MDLKTYLSEERGRQSSLAKSIGAHAPDLSRWADGTRPIPMHYGAPIEQATNGAVTRKEMFPDDWATIWPELAPVAAPVETPRRRSSDRQRKAVQT
jgi:DNA-binding transcriptional regulator YdaS (Cro superfamily)